MSHLEPTPADRLGRHPRMRHVANWVNLSTVLGLGVAMAGGARIRRGPQLLYLAERYRWRFPNGSAFTVGDVVITRHDIGKLTANRPTLLQHEERHSRQWMACLGLPFIPLYLLSMGWSWLRTGDRAARCFFERDAGLATGGYADVPPRPLGPALVKLAREVTRLRTAPSGVRP
ncbi:hypothetical protein [Occultella gossypii]|uniref:DUF4157 domain-containing protein n=1 Tax=Occultella gossypii TaxID=2800820 RepID=A0ABS7SCK9_9MICO|nr:hypothetical protein [Occultella gossypii]MBZ2197485.1 hypothetical protein [Occultella gossypii]